MKSLFAPALVFLALPLCAQTGAAPSAPAPSAGAPAPSITLPPGALSSPVFAPLTDAEKTQFSNAYTKAMTSDTALQKQQTDLREKGMALRASGAPPTEAQMQSLRAAAKAFYDNLRAGMIKADPTLQPILTKVEAETAKLKAQQAH